jgi:hypothetical protein
MEDIENMEEASETSATESKDVEVIDFSEDRFEIREDLELIHYNNIFHLISENDYVVFNDSSHFVKVDDHSYVIKQDTATITVTNDEYDMIEKAMLHVRGNNK